MNVAKSQRSVARNKILDVNPSDWFKFNRFLSICFSDFIYPFSYNFYHLKFSFISLYERESLEVNRAISKHSRPGDSVVQYFPGGPLRGPWLWESPQGSAWACHFSRCAGLTQANTLASWWGCRLPFSHVFFPVQPKHDGNWMEAAASAAEVAAEQALRSYSLSHLIMLTSGRVRQ